MYTQTPLTCSPHMRYAATLPYEIRKLKKNVTEFSR